MARPFLEIRGLTAQVRGQTLLAPVDLRLQPGQVGAVIGPCGGGREIFVDLLAGMLPASGGRIVLDRKDLRRLGRVARARRGLVAGFADLPPAGSLTVFEIVRLGALVAQAKSAGIWRRVARDRRLTALCWQVLETAGLAARAGWPAERLDLLDRRRLMLAALLARQPKVLLLDQPLAGLSQEQTEALLPALEALRTRFDRAVLIAEPGFALAARLADTVLLLREGAPVAHGAPDTVAPRAVWHEPMPASLQEAANGR